jgi:hypothetical protein
MKATDAASWRLAMESKMDSIRVNGTWDLVKLPRNRKSLPCKWVYRLKQVPDSSGPKYKARIVAKGFRQEYSVDFDEVFLILYVDYMLLFGRHIGELAELQRHILL